MSNVIVDGFASYGVGQVNAAMLAGAWANVHFLMVVDVEQGLPWDPADQSFYFSGSRNGTGADSTIRRVLPATQAVTFASFHAAAAELPTTNDSAGPIDFRTVTNAIIGTLYIQSTGALAFNYGNGEVLSSGPVVVAQTAHHYEIELDTGNKAIKVYIDGAVVINSTALNFVTGTTGCAQFAICATTVHAGGFEEPRIYITDLVMRDANGGVNDTIPIGDRKVATLFVNRDDIANQGWTARPLERFGTGILNLTASQAAALAPVTVNTNIGAADFTLEGQFRLQSLPTGANKAVLCGKWDENAGNLRSYQLYLGGPSLESGALVFRTSTDGASGTVVEKLTWPWVPIVGHWYHVAICRDGGALKLFIDGVMQGVPITDADTYFASTANAALGGQTNGATSLVNTQWVGWMDEWRMTVGLSRYNSNFTPPTTAFPRGGADVDWADVKWLSSWDNGSIADDGPLALAVFGVHSAAAITPDDGAANFEVIDKHTPNDDTFLEASLIAATGTLTLTARPGNTETVTVGTKDGSTAAVYTFKTAISTAFDVLIGATQLDSVTNLVAAINAAAGSGTLYGSSTTANFDVVASLLPSGQMLVTALLPGTGGNAIASTETLSAGSWAHATLTGGLAIPGFSAFGFDRLPRDAVIVDSVTFATRQWKTDAGAGSTQMTFVGAEGGTLDGTERALTGTPTLYFDLFEEDPDTTSTLTPQSILSGEIKVNRTV